MSYSETPSETGGTQGSSPSQSRQSGEEGSSSNSHPCSHTPDNPRQTPSADNSPMEDSDDLVQQIQEIIHARLATVTHEQWYIGVERVTLQEMADELERELPVEGHPWTVELIVNMLKGMGEQSLGLAPLYPSPRTDLFPLTRQAAKSWTGIPRGYREEEPRPTKWTRYEHDAFWRLKNSDENVYNTERGFSNWIISPFYQKLRRSLEELQIPYPFTADQTSKAYGDLTLEFEDVDEVRWSDKRQFLGSRLVLGYILINYGADGGLGLEADNELDVFYVNNNGVIYISYL